MADTHRASQYRRLCLSICVCAFFLLIVFSQVFRNGQERRRRDVLDSTEIPAENIDPAAIDLTPLVNTLINSSQLGSRQLFSLLSVTSYSSLALHKLTLLVYNVSSVRSLERDVFTRKFCYCVTNDTNDLTDFTAILLDVIGNSTSYLHELFKSASILSVSQRNNSACIYICVMAGETSREVPELWDVGSITPLFNQTIAEGPYRGNVSNFTLPLERHQLPTNLSHVPPSATNSVLSSRVHATAHVSLTTDVDEMAPTTTKIAAVQHPSTLRPHSRTTAEWTQMGRSGTGGQPAVTGSLLPTSTTVSPTTAVRSSQLTALTSPAHSSTFPPPPPTEGHTRLSGRTTTASSSVQTERAGCPWKRPELMGGPSSGSTTAVGAHKLQPCILELCKFFSQCLCRPFRLRSRMTRYCDDSHLWYERHTSEVCRRVRRVSFSRSLKQRCLTKMCDKL